MAHETSSPTSPRWFAGLIATVGWGALALQLGLIIVKAGELGIGPGFGVLAFASFFTIQVNLLAAVVTGLIATGVSDLAAGSRFKTAIAVYVAAAGAIFFLFLQPVWHHTGLQLLADILLHFVMPVLFGLLWLAAVPKDQLRWRDPLIWMIYPVCYQVLYLVAALTVGQRIDFDLYPFLDFRALGAAMVAMNIAAVAGIFLAMGLLAVAVGRLVSAFGYEPRHGI